MNNNPIEELRDLTVPVSEQEWEAIVHDKRYLKKFGQKTGLSPKGRAALIAGAAAVLITVPILISTLSHKTTDTAQDSTPVVQTAAPQPESVKETTTTASPMTTSPATTPKSETKEAPLAVPSASSTTSQTATHEQSTLVAATEARVPTNDQPTLTNKPAVSTATSQQAVPVSTTPKITRPTTISNNEKADPDVDGFRPPTANINSSDDQPTIENGQEGPVTETSNFFIPSAFTPNGDGLNDFFQIKADFVPKQFEMNIYNRRSTLVFHSNNIDAGWDGKLNGHTLPNGVYIYVIRFSNSDGRMQQKTGQVMLLQ